MKQRLLLLGVVVGILISLTVFTKAPQAQAQSGIYPYPYPYTISIPFIVR